MKRIQNIVLYITKYMFKKGVYNSSNVDMCT